MGKLVFAIREKPFDLGWRLFLIGGIEVAGSVLGSGADFRSRLRLRRRVEVKVFGGVFFRTGGLH